MRALRLFIPLGRGVGLWLGAGELREGLGFMAS